MRVCIVVAAAVMFIATSAIAGETRRALEGGASLTVGPAAHGYMTLRGENTGAVPLQVYDEADGVLLLRGVIQPGLPFSVDLRPGQKGVFANPSKEAASIALFYAGAEQDLDVRVVAPRAHR